MSCNTHISRTEADTKRLIFQIVSKIAPTGENIAAWTNFSLTINPLEFPTDNTGNVDTLIGVIIEAEKGRVYFVPTGTIVTGNYFYNARGTDENGEVVTFAKGKYNIAEKIAA